MDLPERVAQHLHAREIARKVQVQADTCIRLRRALRANIRPTGDKKENGSWVYMKRMEDRQWKGPGQVWSQLGTNIMVKQGSTMWHARHEDCIRVREEDVAEIEREAEMRDQPNVKQFQEASAEDIEEEIVGNSEPIEEGPITEHKEVEEVELEIIPRRKTSRSRTLTRSAVTDRNEGTEVEAEKETTAERSCEEDTTEAPRMEESNVTPEEEEANEEATEQEETSPSEESQSNLEENNSCQPDEPEANHGPSPLSTQGGGGQVASSHMRPAVQLGDPLHLPGLDGGEEVPSSERREEEENRSSARRKGPGKGNSSNLRMKKKKDLGLRSGTVVKLGVEDGSVLEGTVLRRTTKKNGRYPNNYDVKNNANDEILNDVNFDVVDWYLHEEDTAIEEICQVTEEEVHEVHEVFATMIEKERHDEEGVIDAKKKELESIKRYGTYEEVWSSEVPEEDRDKVITTTWNVVEKDDHRIKARVCVRGFQEKTKHRRDSPTASKVSQRLFLSKAVELEWKVHSLDVSAAFLQGDYIDRTVYVIPPKEFLPTRPARQEAILWKLIRPLYGLTDASRKWYCRMDKELTKLGCLRSKYDHAVYNFWKGGELHGQVLLHVDDLLNGGSDLFHRKVISSFMKMFTVGSKEDTDFVCVGWHLKQSRQGITVKPRQLHQESRQS